MGTITSNFFISLDGVVESPHEWHFPYFNDEMGAVVGAGVTTTSAFLMGRKLYDEWSEYWPGQRIDYPEGVQANADDFGAFINAVPKYVVSNTLREATWENTTIISGDVADGIRALKASTDGTITMSGSATLSRWLLANGLLDELALLVHPIVVGHGQRLFEDDTTIPLELTHHATLSTGVLHLTYAPKRA